MPNDTPRSQDDLTDAQDDLELTDDQLEDVAGGADWNDPSWGPDWPPTTGD